MAAHGTASLTWTTKPAPGAVGRRLATAAPTGGRTMSWVTMMSKEKPGRTVMVGFWSSCFWAKVWPLWLTELATLDAAAWAGFG